MYYEKYKKYKSKYKQYLEKNKKESIENINKTKIKIKHNFVNNDIDYYTKKYVNMEEFIRKNKIRNKIRELNNQYAHNYTFYYIYTMKITLENEEKIELDDIILYNCKTRFILKRGKELYINFFLIEEEMKELYITINKKLNISKISLSKLSYKTGDSYALGPSKPLKNIYGIIQQQYFNRINYRTNLSNIMFNEICSNKLDYHQYLMDNNIIPKNTTKIIKNLDETYNEKIREENKNNVIKFPYSSMSKCVSMPDDIVENRKISENKIKIQKYKSNRYCFENEGFVTQKYNETLSQIELKCHVIYGEILYVMVRNEIGEYTAIYKDLKISNKKTAEILNKYKDEIIKLCEDTFKMMNKLEIIKEKRLNHEMNILYKIVSKLIRPYIKIELNNFNKNNFNKELNRLYKNDKLPDYIREFLKPFKQKKNFASFEAMFTSLLVYKKIRRLRELNNKILKIDIEEQQDLEILINELINLYNTTDLEFEKTYLTNIKMDKIKEPYMRIDIALPSKEYKKCYVNEIEPFASGKGNINGIEELEKHGLTIKTLIMKKIYEKNIDEDYNYIYFKDVKYEKVI